VAYEIILYISYTWNITSQKNQSGFMRIFMLCGYAPWIVPSFEPRKNIVRKIIRLADFPGTLAAFCRWP
jgi:hypothetical protein